MPSPRQQSPERARLRTHIEDQVEALDITWAELARASGVPYETIRRVRDGNRPITKDVRDRLEDGLGWARGSIRDILDGGDPTPANPRISIENHVLDTRVGQVLYQVIQDLNADQDPERRAKIDAALAERFANDAELFMRAMRAERDEQPT
jgi:hypothetical protein